MLYIVEYEIKKSKTNIKNMIFKVKAVSEVDATFKADMELARIKNRKYSRYKSCKTVLKGVSCIDEKQ